MMKIFQIPLSRVITDEVALNWITTDGGYGRKEERYWLVKTDVNVSNPQNNLAMHNLLLFLHFARAGNYQTVQIMKDV